MKKVIYSVVVVFLFTVLMSTTASAQDEGNLVHIVKMKTKWPEKGSAKERDSLILIYNTNVIKKNDKILSHREYGHYFTANSQDYLVVEEYKDFASLQAAWKMNEELEKKAWPKEEERKAFMKAMNAYFETWHGDELYNTNSSLSKN